MVCEKKGNRERHFMSLLSEVIVLSFPKKNPRQIACPSKHGKQRVYGIMRKESATKTRNVVTIYTYHKKIEKEKVIKKKEH